MDCQGQMGIGKYYNKHEESGMSKYSAERSAIHGNLLGKIL